MTDEDDGDYQGVSAMADRLKLTGRDRDRYIHQHMTGLGYKMQPSYIRAEEGDDDDDDDNDRFFGGRRSRPNRGDRESGDRGDRGGRSSRSRGGDDWYGN